MVPTGPRGRVDLVGPVRGLVRPDQPSSSGGGTRHTGSSGTAKMAVAAALLFIRLPAVVVVSLASFLLHGYGVL